MTEPNEHRSVVKTQRLACAASFSHARHAILPNCALSSLATLASLSIVVRSNTTSSPVTGSCTVTFALET